MTEHPYKNLPWQSWWRDAVERLPEEDIDPCTPSSILISKSTKIATAGSCFAQNVARALEERELLHHVVEPGPDWLSAEQARNYNYGLYSARFGNIYTARQLRQLLQRACGELQPHEQAWRNGEFWIDPLRPYIQPDGFVTHAELDADRAAHLRQVRRLFEELDVFIFTLGLSEGWCSKADGTVFPVCPGGRRGAFDADRYEFHNFTADEVTADLAEFCSRLESINPRAQVILTVSPVPLIATMEPWHVLSATTYSKSVLRVAAEQTRQAFKQVEYFPSYEIITGTFQTAKYFGEDRRSVTKEGIQHVMNCFFRTYAESNDVQSSGLRAQPDTTSSTFTVADQLARDLCDEEQLLAHLRTSHPVPR